VPGYGYGLPYLDPGKTCTPRAGSRVFLLSCQGVPNPLKHAAHIRGLSNFGDMCSILVRIQSRSSEGRASVHDMQREQFILASIFAPHTAAQARGLIGAESTRIRPREAPLQALVIRRDMHEHSRRFIIALSLPPLSLPPLYWTTLSLTQ
jgi:hypothetical protein